MGSVKENGMRFWLVCRRAEWRCEDAGDVPSELAYVFMYHSDVMISAMASEITGVSIVCLTVCSGADQRKHQSSASLVFVGEIHRWSVGFPHKGPVTRTCFHVRMLVIRSEKGGGYTGFILILFVECIRKCKLFYQADLNNASTVTVEII